MQFWRVVLLITTLNGFVVVATAAADADLDENCAYWAEMGECHKVSYELEWCFRIDLEALFSGSSFSSSELSLYAQDMSSVLCKS